MAISYDTQPHDAQLRAGHPRLYKPDRVNPDYETDTEQGDFDAAFGAADVTVDVSYEIPWLHNNPMEPHATLAVWDGGNLTVYDSTLAGGSAGTASWGTAVHEACEIGIVGTAAAIGNAVYHATGVRFRRLPIRVDHVLTALS